MVQFVKVQAMNWFGHVERWPREVDSLEKKKVEAKDVAGSLKTMKMKTWRRRVANTEDTKRSGST